MGQLLQFGELLLLVLLAILQLGRWSQKTENGPADAIRIAKDAKDKADETANDLRKHKNSWQDFLNARYTVLDNTYARKREVELELTNIRDKQDNDCDRITALEERVERLSEV